MLFIQCLCFNQIVSRIKFNSFLNMDLDSKFIQKLYIAYFGRPADPSGINYWVSNFKGDIKVISSLLARQEEYQNFMNSCESIDLQINQFYLNLFSRKADIKVINNFLVLIENKTCNLSDLVCYLIGSLVNDMLNKKEIFSNQDLKTLDNKVEAAELFTKEISSSISWVTLYQPESIDPWLTGKSLSIGINFLKQFDYSKKANRENVLTALKSFCLDSIEILNQPVIELKNVSVKIPINGNENRKFTKIITSKMINTFIGGELTHVDKHTTVEALKNISLTIMSGERVALIGHNGSGKSSLLRLISGIYSPSSGEIRNHVEVYPMLQKTFLTSSELSGVDASKAYYLMMKHNLKGFEEFLEDIVSFSQLGSFIHLPIKTYSEGMCARLIFSMLTSSSHECLVIDEGFGTGDSDFFERAQKRMESFMNSATTLILASHSEFLLKQFCIRGIVLNHGSIVFDGSLDTALNYYHTHGYYHQNAI